MFDSHIHTHFSHDSVLKIRDLIISAKEKNLTGIAITDHIDHELFVNGEEVYLFDLIDYANEIKQIQTELLNKNDSFKLLIGLEEGYIPEQINEIKNDIALINPDFVILSTHMVDDFDLYKPDFYAGKTKKQAYDRYLDYIIDGLENFDIYDSVGHMGYIGRYSPYENPQLLYNEHSARFDKIFNTLIKHDKAFEINTSGFRRFNDSIPGIDVISAYINAGGNLLTLASDSHQLEHVGYKFESVCNSLKKLGLNEITYFEQRQPKFIQI